MTHFTGRLYGSRPPGAPHQLRGYVSAQGTRDRGIEAILGSETGSVSVRLTVNGAGVDIVTLYFTNRHGPGFELYQGPLAAVDVACIRTATHEAEL